MLVVGYHCLPTKPHLIYYSGFTRRKVWTKLSIVCNRKQLLLLLPLKTLISWSKDCCKQGQALAGQCPATHNECVCIPKHWIIQYLTLGLALHWSHPRGHRGRELSVSSSHQPSAAQQHTSLGERGILISQWFPTDGDTLISSFTGCRSSTQALWKQARLRKWKADA